MMGRMLLAQGWKYKRRPKRQNKHLELVEPLVLALERVGPDSQLEVLYPQVVQVWAPQRQHLCLEPRLNGQPKLPTSGATGT